MDKNNKQFGLILPKSKQGASSNAKKPVANIFKQDSSSEDDETKAVVSGGTDWMKRKIASGATVNAKSGATGLGTKITSHHVLMKQKALEEDPTIFQVCCNINIFIYRDIKVLFIRSNIYWIYKKVNVIIRE